MGELLDDVLNRRNRIPVEDAIFSIHSVNGAVISVNLHRKSDPTPTQFEGLPFDGVEFRVISGEEALKWGLGASRTVLEIFPPRARCHPNDDYSQFSIKRGEPKIFAHLSDMSEEEYLNVLEESKNALWVDRI